jgi:hypothetical protein
VLATPQPLYASFPRSVALTQLSFASVSMI